MQTSLRLLSAGLILLFINACIKDLEVDSNSNNQVNNPSMSELKVPADFKWETTVSFNLTVNVTSFKAYQPKSKLSVYNGPPESGGEIIASGSADSESPYQTQIVVPASTEIIYLKKESPFGGISGIELEVTGNDINYTFNDGTFNYHGSGIQEFKSILNGPDCETGCDITVTGNSNINISGGQTYCINSSFTGKVTFQTWNGGGTLRICGTANLTNNTIGMYSNCNIIVAEGGSLSTNTIEMGNNSTITIYNDATANIGKFNCWSEMASITNYGQLNVTQNSYYKTSLENYGTIEFAGDVDIDQSPVLNSGEILIGNNLEIYGSLLNLTNSGIMTISGDFDISNDAKLTNAGSIYVGDDLAISTQIIFVNQGEIKVNGKSEFNGTSVFTNYCKFESEDNISLNASSSVVLHNGFFKTNEKLYVWTSGTISMADGSMISCGYTEINKNILGTGELNSMVVYGDAKIWNNNKIDGAIEMALESGELAYGNSSNFINGATFTNLDDVINYLPITACNPDGLGTPSIVDMDNDGIPDELDEYPDDPLRAFNNYFPEANSHGTIAFEDLWPATGDYDFNDLVVAFYGNEISNAENDLVDIYLYFIVEAAGASLQNGFGFQMNNITPDMISEVSGMVLERGYVSQLENGTEANQEKAVIVVTENVEDVNTRNGESMFNTIPGNPLGSSDTIEIVIHFNVPVDPDLVTFESYNPFLIKDQQRSNEIHLPYFAPTSLMNTALFGTGQDASNAETGNYFITKDNLPWGIMMLEPFDYPIEKAEITDSYNFFATWAESGGALYTNWYNSGNGYQNDANIYSP